MDSDLTSGKLLGISTGSRSLIGGQLYHPPRVSAHSPQGKKHGKGSMMGKPRRFHWANGPKKIRLPNWPWIPWSPPFWRPNKPHPHTNMILPMMFTSFQTRNSLEKKTHPSIYPQHIPRLFSTAFDLSTFTSATKACQVGKVLPKPMGLVLAQ